MSTDVGGVRGRRRRRRSRASSSRRATSTRSPSGSSGSPATRELRERFGAGGPRLRAARATRCRGSSTTSTRSTGAARRSRAGAPTAARDRAAAADASRRSDRAPRTAAAARSLLVSQYFPPEVGATQSRMQSFAEYLAERGHDVTVIAEFPNHPHGVMPPRVPRPARRGRPLEPVPRAARLGEGERARRRR